MRQNLKKLKLILLLPIILACGCTHKVPRKVVIDETFNAEEKRLISDAIILWTDATDSVDAGAYISHDYNYGEFTIPKYVNKHDAVVIFRLDCLGEDNDEYKRMLGIHQSFGGKASIGHGNIIICGDKYSSDNPVRFVDLIAHEYGHILGLDHNSGGGIMHAGQGGSLACILEPDLDDYCDDNECGYPQEICY